MIRKFARSALVAVLIAAFLVVLPAPSAQAAEAPPVFSLTWGTSGSGNGQLGYPDGVAVDGSGDVYVADTSNNRIQKFSATGAYLTQWGSYGSGDGQFQSPEGVAVDASGNVYVTDLFNGRVQKFTSTGTYLTQWATTGRGVAVDAAGNVYVADYGNNRIRKFTSTGTYLTQWGTMGNGNGQFNAPTGIAVDAAGNVYVADFGNARIQKFTSTGTYLSQWGTMGSGNGQFAGAFGIAVDTVGSVYVTDININRVQKFTSTGSFLTQWGTTGTGNGQFSSPSAVAVDTSGNVFVADYSPRVQKFLPAAWLTIAKSADETTVTAGAVIHFHVTVTNTGNVPLTGVTVTDTRTPACVGSMADLAVGATHVVDCNYTTTGADIGTYANSATVDTNETDAAFTSNTVNVTVSAAAQSEPPPVFIRTWGTEGSGNSEFTSPRGVAVDGSGNVYVADAGNYRVQKFSAAGAYLTQWGTYGTGDGQFNYPYGVAVDGSGNVYVADYWNNRVQKFTSTGTYLTQWGTGGSADGQFHGPGGVAVDGAGNVYVADSSNHRIQSFMSTGTFLTKWGTTGTGDGQFNYPSGVAVDASGNVYVADSSNHRIQKFSATGAYLTQWGNNGTGDGQFNYPYGVAVDTSGNLYVAEVANHRIQKFSSTGTFLTKWGNNGTGNDQFNNPLAVAVDASGNVYTGDTGNNRIQKFRSADVTDPTVDLRTPAADEAFVVGSAATADFSCDDEADGSGIDTCVGTVVDGTPIDTSALGAHDFIVTATDNAGNSSTVTHSYSVVRTAEINGTVTETATTTPLEGTWVVALRASDFGLAGGALTDVSGHYVLPVDPGSYYLEFVDPLMSHEIEWHDGHAFDQLAAADPVPATAGTPTTVDVDLTDPTGTITGTITDHTTGDPVVGAGVAVMRSGASQPLAAVTTDTAGNYRLAALAPGTYVVVAATSTGTYHPRFHGDTDQVDEATPITISPGTRADADITLSPATVDPPTTTITGTVTDDITNQPEPGALVGALRAADFRFTAATFTDADGHYSLGLPNGDYLLEFFDLDTGHHFEWYDNQLDPAAGAELTTVTAGGTADAAMTPLEGTVAGTITDQTTGDPVHGAWVAVMGYTDGQPVAGTTTDTDGHYTLPAIDNGDYYLVFIDPTGSHALEFHGGTNGPNAATPVTVTGSHTTTIDATIDATIAPTP